MKAWRVQLKDEFFAEVVFAETRGKARSLAMACDGFEDAKFTEIEVNREPQIDKYFKEGKWHMDWENPKDRIALVRELGFHCEREYIDFEWCDDCSAKEYCDYYKDLIQESFELQEMGCGE